jgi:predicted PurR-regulated permease PerM
MLGMDERALRVAWTVFLFALLLLIIYTIRDTLLVFAVSIFFAYMLLPVVSLIERFVRKRRTLALTVVYILLVGAMVGIGFALIPALGAEATSLAKRLPKVMEAGNLVNFPLPNFLKPVRTQIVETLTREAANLEAKVVPLIQQAGKSVLSGVGYLLPLILIPILGFFFLKDGRDIRHAVLGTVDDGHDRTTVELILDDIHSVLKNYIRALVILSVASFCAYLIFLNLMGYSYELLLAGMAGLFEFIPVIGPVAALLIILIVCGITGSSTAGLLWIVLFWACYRVFQDYILNPYLMSAGVEVHPLLVLFGVLAGEKIGGIPGMFFSIPVIAILRVIYNHLKGAYLRRPLSHV